MSQIGRKIPALGLTAALLFGAGLATASAASAAPAHRSSSTGVTGWVYQDHYDTADECLAVGRTSGERWKCEQEMDRFALYFYRS